MPSRTPATTTTHALAPFAPLLALALALVACSPAAPPAPARPLPVPPAPAAPASASKVTSPPPSDSPAPSTSTARPNGAAFGGDRWGFVEASSADGRIAVLRRFDGSARPQFGHHGDSSTPTHVTVYDGVAGTEHDVDDIIDVDPSRRWFLLVDGGGPRLLDARSGTTGALDKADALADGNRCLPPRMAGFSPLGKRVGWVTGADFHVRDLASNDEWVVKAQGRLWRGWPEDDQRGAILLEVPAGSTDWPQQHTSCACRWCGRFAASYGVYGWGGPAFDVTHVAEDGTRSKGTPQEARRRWHGPTDSGCTLEPTSDDAGLSRGPWQWRCAAKAPAAASP